MNIKMNKKKTKIVISGALGRMGQVLIKEILKNQDTSLIAAILNIKSQKKQKQQIKKQKFPNISFLKNLEEITVKKDFSYDVLIDFTTPENTLNNLEYCVKNKKNIIIGTTGFNEKQMKIITSASKKIAILFSPNFSIGINILYNVVQYITKIIGKNTDIEIIEAHHRNKIDAPSGTALQIGKKIAESMNWNFDQHTIFHRHGLTKTREKNKIGFSTIRGGDIIGEHKILFADIGEQIKIIHKATNRSAFAKGAIKAAIWIKNKKYGFFNMTDIFQNLSTI